jgi:hypothetical protein
MSNIFDEVDDILSEVDSVTSEMESSDLVEKNFNESELQDIMAEIESLEKEFETEVSLAPVAKGKSLQTEIDEELEESLQEKNSVQAPVKTAEPKVLAFEKKPMTSPMTSPTTTNASPKEKISNSEISFSAQGQMNLNLEFAIGEEIAKLTIDPIKGLIVTMSGVELCINQSEGCNVTMDSGVKFTIPLTSSTPAIKKKSA